jgi:hypothetical protein
MVFLGSSNNILGKHLNEQTAVSVRVILNSLSVHPTKRAEVRPLNSAVNYPPLKQAPEG